MQIIENTSLQELYNRQTEHFLKILDDLKIEERPYTHFESTELFTDEFYEYMKRIMPEKDELLSLTEISKQVKSLFKVSASYSDKRLSFNINDPIYGYKIMDQFLVYPTNRKKYVKLHEWFSNIFLPNLAKKFNVEMQNITGNELMYINDVSGYELSPHTDIVSKIFSVLIYMPDDDSMSRCGTQMLVPSTTKKHFNVAKTAKFIPKNTFAFVRSEKSWHSVSKIESEYPRKLLLFTAVNKNLVF